MTGIVIFLNGASSSGKTSIARQLLKLSKQNFAHIELDDAFERMPVPKETHYNKVIYIHRPVSQRLWDVVNKNNNVILDGFFTSQREFTDYIKPFLRSTVYFVKVIANLEKCIEREIKRRDRPKGVAGTLYNKIYDNFPCSDLIIDTGTDVMPLENARKILEFINKYKEPYAFRNHIQQKFGLNTKKLGKLGEAELDEVLEKEFIL